MLGRTPFICDSIGNFSIVHSFRFVQSARSATMNQYRRIESDLTKSKTIELNAVYWAVPVVQCGIHCRVLPSFCRSSQYQYQMIWIFILLYRLRSGNRPTDRHRRKETAAAAAGGICKRLVNLFVWSLFCSVAPVAVAVACRINVFRISIHILCKHLLPFRSVALLLRPP